MIRLDIIKNDLDIGFRCHSHMFRFLESRKAESQRAGLLVGIQHTGSPTKALGDDNTIFRWVLEVISKSKVSLSLRVPTMSVGTKQSEN
jgi:hypothetical protein